MKSKRKTFSIFTFFSFVFIFVYASFCVGGVLFEEDFEGKIDKDKWDFPAAWKIDKGVLDANAGEVGITVKDNFTDFEFSVDFNMVSPLWAAEFVLRAQDKDNLYMVQCVFDDRNAFWWHVKVGGNYNISDENKLPNESDVQPDVGEWYSVKIVAEGKRFEFYLGEQGEELELASIWEDDTYTSGAVGFREGGGEHCMYDNVLVTTVGYTQAIAPHKSLPTIWARIKSRYY